MKNKKASSRKQTGTRPLLLGAIAVLAVLLVLLMSVAFGSEPPTPTEPPISTDPTVPTDPTDPTGIQTVPPTTPTEPPTEPPTVPTTTPVDETVPTEPGHIHESVRTQVVPPDCTHGGYSIYVCGCGYSYASDETAPLGHNYFNEVVPPTHVAGGYTRHTCQRCGFDYTDEYTDRIPYESQPTDPPQSMYNLIHGLQITDMGAYTGPYMEDGTDEQVSNVLMIVLTNTGTEMLQYARIEMAGPSGTATFSVTSLPPGASVLLLEQNRMKDSPDLEFTSAIARDVVFFQEEQTIHTDWFLIQGMEGALNVTNTSGQAITGTVEIYYKRMVDGLLYGGITYVCRITDGMAAWETRQIMTGHFSSSESVILFVRVVS